MNLQIQSLEGWEMTDIKSSGISIRKIWDIKKYGSKSNLKDEMRNFNQNGGMELKNQIVEMDASSNAPENGIQKISKQIDVWKCWIYLKSRFRNWNSKRNNYHLELKSISSVLIFMLQSWDLRTCEYVFDVESMCKQKVSEATDFCCPFVKAQPDLQLEKMFQNQAWPVKSMSNQTHHICAFEQNPRNMTFQINTENHYGNQSKYQYFWWKCDFWTHNEKTWRRKGQINTNKKTILFFDQDEYSIPRDCQVTVANFQLLSLNWLAGWVRAQHDLSNTREPLMQLAQPNICTGFALL